MPDPLIQLHGLGISFKGRPRGFGRKARFWGINQVSLTLEQGDSFCLIGESGSGKSTLALALAGLAPFQAGYLTFKGQRIIAPNDRNHKRLIKKTQMVFQDPVQALSPFQSLLRSLEEPLKARGIRRRERERRLAPLIRDTGLTEELLLRRPSQVSGGQNQRACIARSLAIRPELLILDEPLTALDSLIKPRIIRLLCRIKEKYPTTCLIITHDMGLVKAMATRVGVIYLGRILEKGPAASLLSRPAHPYTRALLSASFTPGIWRGKRMVLQGDAPSVLDLPQGCTFHTRCPQVMDICRKKAPKQVEIFPGHTLSCHLYLPKEAPCPDS